MICISSYIGGGNDLLDIIIHTLSCAPSLGRSETLDSKQEWEDRYIERHQVKDVDQKWKRVDIYKHENQANIKKGFTRYVFVLFLPENVFLRTHRDLQNYYEFCRLR